MLRLLHSNFVKNINIPNAPIFNRKFATFNLFFTELPINISWNEIRSLDILNMMGRDTWVFSFSFLFVSTALFSESTSWLSFPSLVWPSSRKLLLSSSIRSKNRWKGWDDGTAAIGGHTKGITILMSKGAIVYLVRRSGVWTFIATACMEPRLIHPLLLYAYPMCT